MTIIKKAYDNVKSDYTYLEDVRVESGLSEKVFLLCITELARQNQIELMPGYQPWNDTKQGYQVGNETFYGVQWIKDTPEKQSAPSAFEMLFHRITEITALLESTDKKKAVQLIKTEFPEFSDMSENTIKTNITGFPFLFHSIVSEHEGIKNQLETSRQANKAILTELDTVKAENTTLHNDLDKVRQDLSKNKGITQELDRVRKENESLKSELDIFRQDLDKGVDMDFRQEIEDLKSRMASIETTLQENVSQKLDKSLDKEVSNLDIPESVDSWRVVFKEPYYKLYKVINGKLIWIHIGREFSEDMAKKKIQEKLTKLDKDLSKVS
jgi:hypothetical protein